MPIDGQLALESMGAWRKISLRNDVDTLAVSFIFYLMAQFCSSLLNRRRSRYRGSDNFDSIDIEGFRDSSPIL